MTRRMMCGFESEPGSLWTTRAYKSDVGANDATYSSALGLHVMVGNSGAIEISTDAKIWTSVSYPTTSNLLGIVWGGTQFVVVGSNGTILVSQNGRSWTTVSSPVATTLKRVAWSGSLFVAVGDNGVILTSSNGTTWSQQNSGVSVTLNSVTWGNSTFVAVGESTAAGTDYTILTSSNGVSWTSRASGSGALSSGKISANDISWNGTTFFIVGGSSESGYTDCITSLSSNVTSWTSTLQTSVNKAVNRVFWAGSRFVITAETLVTWFLSSSDESTSVYYSLTGDQVVPIQLSTTFGIGYWTGNFSVLIINTKTPAIFVSNDGLNWRPTSSIGAFGYRTENQTYFKVSRMPYTVPTWFLSSAQNRNQFICENSKNATEFVLVGQTTLEENFVPDSIKSISSAMYLLMKYDTYQPTWSNETSSYVGKTANGTTPISFENTQINTVDDVESGNGSTIAVSVNKSTSINVSDSVWTQTTGTGTFGQVIKHGSLYVGAGYFGSAYLISTSSDKIFWNTRVLDNFGSGTTNHSLNSVASNGSVLVSVGSGTRGYRSTDGVNWSNLGNIDPNSSTTILRKVAWCGNVFVAVGDVVDSTQSFVLTSSNGISWTRRAAFSGSRQFVGVARSGSTTVIVGSSGAICTSSDNITWTPRSSNTTSFLRDVVWSGSLFVAVGNNGTIITSTDGITWTSRVSGTTTTLTRVAYGNNKFIATHSSSVGAIFISSDGINWTTFSTGLTRISVIYWTGDDFFSVQDGNQFLTVDGNTAINRSDTYSWLMAYAKVVWDGTKFVRCDPELIHYLPSDTYETNLRISTSVNGMTWQTSSTIAAPSYPVSMVWSGSIIVISCADGSVFTSPNGTNWTYRGALDPNSRVIWNGKKFFATGSGTIFSSVNGITWVRENVGEATAETFTQIAGSDKQLIVSGKNYIMTSP